MEDILNVLVWPLTHIKGFSDLIDHLKKSDICKIINTVNAQKPHFVYALNSFHKESENVIIITYDELSAKRFYEDMQFLVGEENVMLYPGRDILFYNADVHSMDITSERIKVIQALSTKKGKVIIASIDALLNPLSPKETFMSYTRNISEEDSINIEKLSKELVQMGYERVSKVEAMGQFAIRGGVIDIYTPIHTEPYRIELWDDEIDSIRTFNVYTQRSINRVKELCIPPNQEIIFPIELLKKAIPEIKKDGQLLIQQLDKENKRQSVFNVKQQIDEVIDQIQNNITPKGLEMYVPYTNMKVVTLFDYLGKGNVIYIDEPQKCKQKCEHVLFEYQESMKDRLEYGHVLPKQIEFIFDYQAVIKEMAGHPLAILMNFDMELEDFNAKYQLSLNVYENNTFYKNMDLLEKDIRRWQEEGKKIIVLGGTKTKALSLYETLKNRNIICAYSNTLEGSQDFGQLLVTKGSLSKGFVYEDIGLSIVSDKDLFGKEKKVKKSPKKHKGNKISSFLELSHGDYVVHETHGVGVFKGVEQVVIEGISRDNIKIEYANQTVLYVPIDQMDMVQKYIGAEGKEPKLSKIGTAEWKNSKAKAKKAIQNIARELIELYSKRYYHRGFAYEPDTVWQKEFEEMFPYEETDDQLEAIQDVKKDMESIKIMDRLICGDVGYGKTEVAIRAAFKAVQNSKQVAYLVPTTILAQQHYDRFKERMENYPITVELLSRFRTYKETKKVLEGLQNGMVDIVIGTHKLLSNDVKFKDLGLVIIDEEQRFGVAHKEKLKQMRNQVDVITLTATPIPRTLHMSLIGVRDMSLLQDAPLERKPVQTYVLEYSKDFIKDAVNRELARGGQVYFLYNQVRNIEEKALELQEILPHAKIAFAHGQMQERELENIMMRFTKGEIEVLVCTTIIETGLDIPNVNTIIINDADKMGLSQLYQLRGRVGRSHQVGYAYLMYQKDKVLKEVAEKRLQAIRQFTQLGAGFKIAMRDLEIRGAGNLLGAQQHGHMESIGYDLYCKMLAEAIEQEKGEKVSESFETTIEIKIDAYIPGYYIEDEMQKLDIYKKIALIKDEKDYYSVQEEIEDRYGTIPPVLQNLLEISLIRALANTLYIVTVLEEQRMVVFKFMPDAPLDVTKLPEIMSEYPGVLKFTGGKNPALRADLSSTPKKELLSNIKNILQSIMKLKNETL